MVESSNVHHSDYINLQKWFDEIISNLRVDQLLMETHLLDKHKAEVYEALIAGKEDFVHDYARKTSSAFFIKNLLDSYFIELGQRKAAPRKIALELSNSKILVWAEIENEDEHTEDSLILTTAKVNNEYSKYGIHVSTTIVEKDDFLKVPDHYKIVLNKEN